MAAGLGGPSPAGLELRGAHHGVHAAIDEQLGAVDEAGLGAEQEGHGGSDFTGVSTPTQWCDEIFDGLGVACVVQTGLQQRCLDRAGGHGVEPDTRLTPGGGTLAHRDGDGIF